MSLKNQVERLERQVASQQPSDEKELFRQLQTYLATLPDDVLRRIGTNQLTRADIAQFRADGMADIILVQEAKDEPGAAN